MTYNWQGALAKISTLLLLALVTYQTVAFIHPLVVAGYVVAEEGMCQIQNVHWLRQRCKNQTTGDFDSGPTLPRFDGIYYIRDVQWHYFGSLHLSDNHLSNISTFFNPGEVPEFNCSTATNQSIKLLIVMHLPGLASVINITSDDLGFGPDVPSLLYQLPCWSNSEIPGVYAAPAYLSRPRSPDKTIVIPFVLTLLLLLFCIFLVSKLDDEDALFGKIAGFFVDLCLLMVFFVTIHMPIWCIASCMCPTLFNGASLDASYDQGSIFRPIYTYIRRKYTEARVEREARTASEATIRAREVIADTPTFSTADPPPPRYDVVIRHAARFNAEEI